MAAGAQFIEMLIFHTRRPVDAGAQVLYVPTAARIVDQLHLSLSHLISVAFFNGIDFVRWKFGSMFSRKTQTNSDLHKMNLKFNKF